jgi:hypothetical protein
MTPESLPSLCEYCGVPETIAFDASVPERQELLQRWAHLTRFDFDCLPCVLEMGTTLRDRLYEYIVENILRLVDWSVLDFETFRADLLKTVELSWAWNKLEPHIWLDYAAETSSAFATQPRKLSDEEIEMVREVVESL